MLPIIGQDLHIGQLIE